MKLKSIFLAGAVAAACVSAAQAEAVYSVNAVGYVNVEVPAGFSMVANPLNAADNTVSALFASAPLGTKVYKFNADEVSFAVNTKGFKGWTDPAMELVPGEGAFIKNATGAKFTVTFVGEILQGPLVTSLPAGFSIASSQVPQAGDLEADLAMDSAVGDLVYLYDASKGYARYERKAGGWDKAPVVGVGEAFWIKKTAAASWSRQFSVNQ